MSRTSSTCLCVSLLLLGCSTPPAPPAYGPRPVVEVARWQAFENGEPRAVVRQLEIRDPAGVVLYYQVLDLQGRLLGSADAQGRFTARVPFQDEEQPIGVWSMAQGVAKLVEAAAPVELRPVPVEASAHKR